MPIPQTYYKPPVQFTEAFPAQHQEFHGEQAKMMPTPLTDNPLYQGSNKLVGRVAVITGGDSGIGQAVAIAFAKEGADIVIACLCNEQDAMETRQLVAMHGRRCHIQLCDLKNEQSAKTVIDAAIHEFGRVDVLVNNVAVQIPQADIDGITAEQLGTTFSTNVFSYFFMVQAALEHMGPGSSIINTASVTAYKGHDKLIDYSATKGAVVSMTRSLSQSLAGKGIRVNAVAPGPVWTPLIVSSFTEQEVAKFGTDVPLKRAAQPFELAPTYVYLASDDSGYVTGQVLHVNGGTIVDS